MSLKFTHKPNYFLHAQSLIHHLVKKIQAAPQNTQLTEYLANIYTVFGEDFASTTANFEGILNIADNYHVAKEEPEYRLIASYQINGTENSITFTFNSKALEALAQGQSVIEPDPNSYE